VYLFRDVFQDSVLPFRLFHRFAKTATRKNCRGNGVLLPVIVQRSLMVLFGRGDSFRSFLRK